MKYSEHEQIDGGWNRKSIATFEIDDLDMIGAKLDNFDRALLAECSKSTKISDKLLALEMIARRIEQSQ